MKSLNSSWGAMWLQGVEGAGQHGLVDPISVARSLGIAGGWTPFQSPAAALKWHELRSGNKVISQDF